MLHTYLPRAISAVLSIVQSTGLRNRVYAMEDRLDILEVAIEDIARINAHSPEPNPLITNIVANVQRHHESIREYIP
jgi:hypothetical protein